MGGVAPAMELTVWDGTSLPWAQFGWFMAMMAADEPGAGEVVFGRRPGAKQPAIWIQVLTLPGGKLTVEVGEPADDMYYRLQPVGSSDTLTPFRISDEWTAQVRAGAALSVEDATDAAAFTLADGAVFAPLWSRHLAEDFWDDVHAGRRHPPHR